MLAGGSPGGLRVPHAGPSGAGGRNAISAVWPVRNRLSAARTSETLYPTVYGPCQKQTLRTPLSTNIRVAHLLLACASYWITEKLLELLKNYCTQAFRAGDQAHSAIVPGHIAMTGLRQNWWYLYVATEHTADHNRVRGCEVEM